LILPVSTLLSLRFVPQKYEQTEMLHRSTGRNDNVFFLDHKRFNIVGDYFTACRAYQFFVFVAHGFIKYCAHANFIFGSLARKGS